MTDVLVSIIMPIYNAENFVKKAIESVMNQSYKNIELICIDDNSTDNSYNICMKLRETYKYNLIKNENNKGQEYTRNYGLNIAKGKYVTFLDADDTIADNMIEIMVNKAEETNVDLVIGLYSKIIENEEHPRFTSLNSGLYSRKEFISFILNDIPFDIISCIGAKLYNLEFIKKNNIYFNKKYKYNEDMGFSLTVINASTNVYYLNETFYKYLIRNTGTVMSSYRPNMFETIENVWLLMKEMFIEIQEFEIKKDEFYLNIACLIINSLLNEVLYSNYEQFKKTADSIVNNNIFEDVNKSEKLTLKYRFFLTLLKMRFYRLCYFLMSLIHIKKRSEVLK